MSAPTHRQQYRALIAQIAAKAKEKLPVSVNGRVEAAARLVILGDVEPLEDGTIRVNGADPTRWYHLVGPTCTCTDFVQGKAPQGWCKHRIAAGIAKRVAEMTSDQGDNCHLETPPLPEARSSLNFRAMKDGFEVQVTLRGESEAAVMQRFQTLVRAHQLRPVPKPAPRTGGWTKARK